MASYQHRIQRLADWRILHLTQGKFMFQRLIYLKLYVVYSKYVFHWMEERLNIIVCYIISVNGYYGGERERLDLSFPSDKRRV